MTLSQGEVSGWGNTILDLVERGYRILRGLPHNRLAITVVGLGGLILAGPWWEPYLRAGIEHAFGIKIDVPTAPIYGFGLVVVGLLYHVAISVVHLRETALKGASAERAIERVRAHDAPLFQAFIAAFPENPVGNAISAIRDNHAYHGSQVKWLVDAYYFLGAANHHFNDAALANCADALKKALNELTDFTATHFYVHGPMGNDPYYAMEPHWNIDRGGNPTPAQSRQYGELTKSLTALSRAVSAAYDRFIRTAHERVL